MPKVPRRRQAGRPKAKPGEKEPYPARQERRLLAQKARIEAQLAALRESGEEPPPQPEKVELEPDYATNRVVVKFFWLQLGKPVDPSEWAHRDGVISVIRRRMGDGAPRMETVRSVLQRLAADEHDDVSRQMVASNPGRPSILSDVEELYAGLLLCEGHSQRSATFIINGERVARGLAPVDRQCIRNAEMHIDLIRRRRRCKKSGSSDLDSAWAKASLAYALQKQAQLRAGAELRSAPTAGPTIRLTDPKKSVVCLPGDEWDIIGLSIRVHWPQLGWFSCTLIGYVSEYKWAKDISPAYILENVTDEWGTTRYPMRSKDVWDRLTVRQRKDIDEAAAARAAAPPPLVPEQMLVVDQHHEKCLLGKTSPYDCKIPKDEDGSFCRVDDGGVYDDWTDNTTVKFSKEVRMHFGIMMYSKDGKMVGDRMEPFDYTGKWVVGPKRIREAVKAVVDQSNRLKGGGEWACTKDYSAKDLAELEGGRWEAWYIEKYGSGEGWREAVEEKVGSGDHALICVTKLMAHTIAEGNRLFKGTRHENDWVINSDRLASWWSAEAQAWLEEQGFKDRQVRAWGECNEQYWRYHESVVGDRPELCALDFRCFNDYTSAIKLNVINTSSLPKGDKRRFDNGTPDELRRAMLRTWQFVPTSERIVEDISRFPVVIDKIVEYKGGVVPDFAVQREGCSKQKRKATEQSRIYVAPPEVQTVMAARSKALWREAERMCR